MLPIAFINVCFGIRIVEAIALACHSIPLFHQLPLHPVVRKQDLSPPQKFHNLK
jgi:hypothetical protein